MTRKIKGTLAVWKDKKGFGFIKPEDGGDDIFMHITALKDMSYRPAIGDIIIFCVEYEQDGRSKAVDAVIEGGVIDDKEGAVSGFMRWLLIFLLIMVVVIATVFGYDKFFNDSQISEQLFVLFDASVATLR